MQRKGCTRSTVAKAMSRLNETSETRSIATPVSDPGSRGIEPGCGIAMDRLSARAGGRTCEPVHTMGKKFSGLSRSGGAARWRQSPAARASASQMTIEPFSISMMPKRFQSWRRLFTLSREPPTSSPSARCEILTPTREATGTASAS